MLLFFDSSANTAFFKAEASVSLLNHEATSSLTRAQRPNLRFTPHAGHRPSAQLKVSLQIHPEQITSLVFTRLPKLPDRLVPVYTRLSNQETLSLRLTLSSPPVLVVPNLPGRLIPHTRIDSDLLTVFQRIAGATTLTTPGLTLALTLYIPGSALTAVETATIRDKWSPSLTVAEKYTKVNSVLNGLGGRVVPPDEVASIVDFTSPTTSPSTRASPPVYGDEAEPGQTLRQTPPEYNSEEREDAGPMRKRMRQSSSSSPLTGPSGGKTNRRDTGDAQGNALSQAQILQQLLDGVGDKILQLQALAAELDAKEELLRARLAEADAKLVELVDSAAQNEHEASQCQYSYIDDRMEELRDEVRDELTAHLDERFEHLGVDMLTRDEMEDFVGEHVQGAMEDLRERLAGGGVRVVLPEE